MIRWIKGNLILFPWIIRFLWFLYFILYHVCNRVRILTVFETSNLAILIHSTLNNIDWKYFVSSELKTLFICSWLNSFIIRKFIRFYESFNSKVNLLLHVLRHACNLFSLSIAVGIFNNAILLKWNIEEWNHVHLSFSHLSFIKFIEISSESRTSFL